MDKIIAIIVLIVAGLCGAIPTIEEENDYSDLIVFDEQ